MILRGVNINWGYIIASAMILVVLVIPNEKDVAQMVVSGVLIYVPAISLQLAISSQEVGIWMGIVFVYAISIPCIISYLQDDIEGLDAKRKNIIIAVIVLTDIAALIATYVLKDYVIQQNVYNGILDQIINVLLLVAIPNYVKTTLQNRYLLLKMEKDGFTLAISDI